MSKDLGAQQADGLSQAEPVVSALRASIPSAESIKTVESIREVLELVTDCERELRIIRAEIFDRRRQLEFEANKTDHPWIGKKVVRTITKRKRQDIWYGGPAQHITRTERGVVTLQGAARAGYRGYSPYPGEVFVLSASGSTAYPMGPRDGWELVSDQDAPKANQP